DQSVAQILLLAAMLVEERLDLAELLAQAIVLAQGVLVVFRSFGEELADFAAIIAAHHRLKLLLPQVERSHFHRSLLSASRVLCVLNADTSRPICQLRAVRRRAASCGTRQRRATICTRAVRS